MRDFKPVILNLIQDPYKYLWIPTFVGMTLIVSLFIFAPSVSALRSIDEIFGRINPPPELAPFTQDKTGAGGISLFLSNLIKLIYAVAAVVLVFMIVWGAFEWLISGGDKEKIAAARGRIVHAIIGIMLFAIAFAIISVLGTFTGFTFFAGQGTGGGSGGTQCSQTRCIYNQGGSCFRGHCLDGSNNCSNSVNCGFVAGCTQVEAVTCPSGNPPAGVCTPGEFKRTCTGSCGNCNTDAGESLIEQCLSDGSRFTIVGSECRLECVGVCP